MKKLVSVLAAVLMAVVCILPVCAESADFLGTWYLTYMVTEGQTVSASDFGFEMSITLNEDGTVVYEAMGDTREGTWALTDGVVAITIDESTVTAQFEEGYMGIEEDGSTMVFSTEAPTPSFVPAAKVAAADVAAFNGTWELSKFDAFGIAGDISMMGDQVTTLFGENLTVVIADGKVAAFGDDASDAVLTDGSLVIAIEGDTEGIMTQTISMCEDGMLCYNIMGMDLYFVAK